MRQNAVSSEELRQRSKHLMSKGFAQTQEKLEVLDITSIEYRNYVDLPLDRPDKTESLDSLIEILGAKLRAKISEVERIRCELHHLADAASIAAIFLDDSVCIRRFTSRIGFFYDLSDGDIGKPLSEKACRLGSFPLSADIDQVKTTRAPVERYLRYGPSAAYFKMRILPNQSKGEALRGMTVSFAPVVPFNLLPPCQA
jgi:two-component system CheB/CheR fusion protein